MIGHATFMTTTPLLLFYINVLSVVQIPRFHLESHELTHKEIADTPVVTLDLPYKNYLY